MTQDCTSSCNANLPGLSLAEMCGASTFFVFMSLLDELVRSNDKISGACERVKPIKSPDDEYDFLIIGGGAAGAAVAARLSENSQWKVLVLEAGLDEPASGQIPIFTEHLRNTLVDWNYTTSNESYACQARNGSCLLNSGKVLGGSTSISGMVYLRGSPTAYDNWAAMGNEGWSWEDVKPYYLKSEDNGEIERVGRFYHATGGPVSVERFPYNFPFTNSILDASREVGYGVSEDLNGEQNTGFSISQMTNKNGVRFSSSRAYLWPTRNRKNLHILLNSQVIKILFKDKTAVGVEYLQDNELKRIFVTREVILSASSIGSPKILLLSGIGPKKHLKSVGIKTVEDLPGVGENFHDHPAYRLHFTVDKPDKYVDNWEVASQYLVNQTGPLSSYGMIAVMGMLSTKATNDNEPNVQIHFYGYTSSCAPGEVDALQTLGKQGISIQMTCLTPKSKGRVSLASKDPFVNPVIWGNYLNDPSDIEVLIDGIELVLKLTNTRAFRALNFTMTSSLNEACSKYAFPSKEYWACDIRQTSVSDFHPVSTCKMGPSSDPMAVVDNRLRVHGMKGLRVVDNSIVPQALPSNTEALAIMIGERAADFIKEDWASHF